MAFQLAGQEAAQPSWGEAQCQRVSTLPSALDALESTQAGGETYANLRLYIIYNHKSYIRYYYYNKCRCQGILYTMCYILRIVFPCDSVNAKVRPKYPRRLNRWS
jgi:hypothetical protein